MVAGFLARVCADLFESWTDEPADVVAGCASTTLRRVREERA